LASSEKPEEIHTVARATVLQARDRERERRRGKGEGTTRRGKGEREERG
jgi:hypothetical protein